MWPYEGSKYGKHFPVSPSSPVLWYWCLRVVSSSVLQVICLQTRMIRSCRGPIGETCWRQMMSESHHTQTRLVVHLCHLRPPCFLSLSSCRMCRPLSAASVGTVGIQDRLNQLVSLFKGRTERKKERLVDPDESEEESPSACMDWLFLQVLSSWSVVIVLICFCLHLLIFHDAPWGKLNSRNFSLNEEDSSRTDVWFLVYG